MKKHPSFKRKALLPTTRQATLVSVRSFFGIVSQKEKIFNLNAVVRLKSKAIKSSDGLCFRTTLGKHLSNVTRRYRIVTSVVFVVVIGSTSCKRSLQVSTNPTSARTYKKNARTSAITCTALDYTISRRARRGKNLVIVSTRSRGIPLKKNVKTSHQ